MEEIITKKCTKCTIEKPLTEFKKGGSKYGRHSQCRSCDSVVGAEYYKKNKEKINVKRNKYKLDNKTKIDEQNEKYRKEHHKEIILKAKERRKRLRKTVIQGYGGKCVCCGENTYEFLSIDHVNGGGGRMRREKIHPRAENFLSWLIKNNFPKEFRLLCHNCNQSLGYNGYCPHQKEGVP